MPLSGARARAETRLAPAVLDVDRDLAKSVDPLKPLYIKDYTKHLDARPLRIPLARRPDLSENSGVIHRLSMLHEPPSGVGNTLHPAKTDANLLANSLTSQSGAQSSDLATANLASWRTPLRRPTGVHTFGCACKAALGSGRMKFQTYRQLGLGVSRVRSSLVSSTSTPGPIPHSLNKICTRWNGSVSGKCNDFSGRVAQGLKL